MFGTKKRPAEPTVIGAGTVIEGTVKVKGGIQVDGKIIGNMIAEGHVSVGPEGSIKGELIGGDIAVGGRVEGKIKASGHLLVVSTGVVKGETVYRSLVVARGGVVDGRTEHIDGQLQPDGVEIETEGLKPVDGLQTDKQFKVVS